MSNVQMEKRSDQYYIGEVLNGDPGSFTPLVEKYRQLAFSLSLKILSHREEAEESAQDAFIKAYKSLGSFKGSASFKTWLFRIVYTTAISRVRQHNHNEVKLDDLKISDREISDTEELLESISKEERIEALQDALNLLDPDERAILNLYYYEDQSVDEISEITALSSSNVKVKLFRSRKKLYQILQVKLKNELISHL